MIKISKQAQHYLTQLLSRQKKIRHLRIHVTFPGTEQAECKISYYDPIQLNHEDVKITYSNFNLYIQKKILPYLKDARIDLFYKDLNKQLMLIAPYAKHTLKNDKTVISNKNYCNNLDLFKNLQTFIQNTINPVLLNHGGEIILVDINEFGYANIKFLGGCNGCAMSSITLKKNIESQILNQFTELKGVKDVTIHNRGQHSFF